MKSTEEKRFEAKSVDAALQQACDYFGSSRDDLEVEVIDSGSSGIFGLGGRQAILKAKPKKGSNELQQLVRTTVSNLLGGIVSEEEIDVSSNDSRVNVSINDEEHSGLIIGREGQTISALEYLTNRILAKRWPEKLYVQIDVGGYRQKQDDSIKQVALNLADKVKQTGKVMSTRPMSSYHRRLVHMALQDDESVVTRSKGDGPMKRVLIMQRRKRNSGSKSA
jgi:spoIIIJ-associated protein